MSKRILLPLVLVSLLVALLIYSQRRHEPLKVSGFIEANEIRIGSRVGGRVSAVRVEEGRRVEPGQVLVELEPYDLRERLAEAQSGLERLQATLSKLKAGPREQEIAVAQARVDLAGAQLERANLTLQRVEKAFTGNAAARDELDRAVADVKAHEAAVQVQRAELALLIAGTRDEEVAEARASVEAAQARVAAIDRQIDELAIKAPSSDSDTFVEAIDLEPGDLVAAGAPVMALTDLGSLWVRAYVPEDHLDVTIGQSVIVTVDSYPGETFAGEISFVAGDAEFTPGNVQTPEDRSQQVFRIKVMLTDGRDKLRPGMAADVWFELPK